MLMLMDLGDVSMRTRNYPSMKRVFTSLKAGEQSLFWKARRLYRFLPALIVLESRCRRAGYNVGYQAVRFGRYLDRREPGQNLEESFRDMASDLALTDQRFADWNIDLISGLDRPRKDGAEGGIRATPEWYKGEWEPEVWEFGSKKDGDEQYRSYERGRQEDYKQKAEKFPLR